MFYECCSEFANLRPRESLLANTRWIFGVEQKTQMKKSRDTENLKVPHIVLLPAEGNNDDTRLMPQFFIATGFRRVSTVTE